MFKYASVRTVLKSSGVPGVVEGNFFYGKRLSCFWSLLMWSSEKRTTTRRLIGRFWPRRLWHHALVFPLVFGQPTRQVFSPYCIATGILTVIDSFEQPLEPDTSSTNVTVPFTFDPSQDYHGKAHFPTLMSFFWRPCPEYRIDVRPWGCPNRVHIIQLFFFSGRSMLLSSTSMVFRRLVLPQMYAYPLFASCVSILMPHGKVPTAAGHWVWNAWSSGDPYWSNGPPTADSLTHIRSIEIYNGFTSTPSGSICNIWTSLHNLPVALILQVCLSGIFHTQHIPSWIINWDRCFVFLLLWRFSVAAIKSPIGDKHTGKSIKIAGGCWFTDISSRGRMRDRQWVGIGLPQSVTIISVEHPWNLEIIRVMGSRRCVLSICLPCISNLNNFWLESNNPLETCPN